jgi:type III restriction enzyme
LSARPFYIKGSNHPKGQSFPRRVSDFGLADAIESGIVKIPPLPVLDATGWPDPKFFRLWERIKERQQPGEPCPKCGKPPAPNAAAVIARLGAFLALPGDGKWAGNSSSAHRPRVIQNPSADFAQKALA